LELYADDNVQMLAKCIIQFLFMFESDIKFKQESLGMIF